MSHETHIAIYEKDSIAFAFGRILKWKSDDSPHIAKNADIDYVTQAGPGDSIDVMQNVLSTAVRMTNASILRVYCFKDVVDAIHIAAQRLDCSVTFDIVSVSNRNAKYAAQCRLMQQMAEKEYVRCNAGEEKLI